MDGSWEEERDGSDILVPDFSLIEKRKEEGVVEVNSKAGFLMRR